PRKNYFIPLDALELWPVLAAVSVQSTAQIFCLNSPVIRQCVACCSVHYGAQLGRACSRHPARKLPQVKSLPGYLAQLRFQNLDSRVFVGKIDAELKVESAFPNQRFIETIQAVGRRHQDKSSDCVIVVNGAHQSHGDDVELPARATWIADCVLPSSPERIDLVDEKQNWFSARCLCKHPLDVLCGCPNPAVEQCGGRNVFEK